MIVIDLETGHALLAGYVLSLMSGGSIRYRPTWLIKPGEPVWHYEENV